MFGLSFQKNTKLSQKDDLKIEELPVHTMQKDLWSIDNPALAQAEAEKSFSPVKPQSEAVKETLTEKQKTSPFLRPEWKTDAPTVIKPVSSPLEEKISEKTVKTSLPQPTNEEINELFGSDKPKMNIKLNGKSLSLILGIIAVLAIGFGGYYFWSTRDITLTENKNSSEPISETPESETTSENPITATPAKPTFDTQRQNDWKIDFLNLDASGLKSALQKELIDIKSSEINGIIELSVKNLNGDPISFSDFSKKIGFIMPAEIISKTQAFSLFVYPEKSSQRLGIELNLGSAANLVKTIRNYEGKLANGLSPILLAESFSIPQKPFQDSQYKNYSVRFINIISPEELSIDYALRGNIWVVGTTKEGLRSILDYLDTNYPVTKNTPSAQLNTSSPEKTSKSTTVTPVKNNETAVSVSGNDLLSSGR